MVEGAFLPPWAALFEGGIGGSLFNSYHFFKVTQEVDRLLVFSHPFFTCPIPEIHRLEDLGIICSLV